MSAGTVAGAADGKAEEETGHRAETKRKLMLTRTQQTALPLEQKLRLKLKRLQLLTAEWAAAADVDAALSLIRKPEYKLKLLTRMKIELPTITDAACSMLMEKLETPLLLHARSSGGGDDK